MAPPALRPRSSFQATFLGRIRSIFENDEYRLLNRSATLNHPDDWNSAAAERLWLYNLHYQDGLLNVETSQDLKVKCINRWIEENPIGIGAGWEPYPISLRVVNWIKWGLSDGILGAGMLESLATQVRVLVRKLEYHLLGNHLFANAKALVFAGLFFEGSEANVWLAKGLKILKQQVPEQFLADGGHFELSTTYHGILTEDLLDLIQIFRIYGRKHPPEWDAVAVRAVDWMTLMTRPDGKPPLFNDAAYGVAPELPQIQAYARRLQLVPLKSVPSGLTHLVASGYFRYQANMYCCFGDVGPIGPNYIPGHAHCDMLNFELFARGRPVLVDTGVSTYEIGKRRSLERGTRSHNTVQIGSKEQSEIWGGFRVGRRARIIECQNGDHWIEAAHDGFKMEGVIHARRFEFERSAILISDALRHVGLSVPRGVARFHLHPEIRPSQQGETILIDGMSMSFVGATSVMIEDFYYAPMFNVTQPSRLVSVTFEGRLRTRIAI